MDTANLIKYALAIVGSILTVAAWVLACVGHAKDGVHISKVATVGLWDVCTYDGGWNCETYDLDDLDGKGNGDKQDNGAARAFLIMASLFGPVPSVLLILGMFIQKEVTKILTIVTTVVFSFLILVGISCSTEYFEIYIDFKPAGSDPTYEHGPAVICPWVGWGLSLVTVVLVVAAYVYEKLTKAGE